MSDIKYPGRKLWCEGEVTIDEKGCLYIKNPYLADEVEAAINGPKHKFCITRDDPNRPGHKQDVMCPC